MKKLKYSLFIISLLSLFILLPMSEINANPIKNQDYVERCSYDRNMKLIGCKIYLLEKEYNSDFRSYTYNTRHSTGFHYVDDVSINEINTTITVKNTNYDDITGVPTTTKEYIAGSETYAVRGPQISSAKYDHAEIYQNGNTSLNRPLRLHSWSELFYKEGPNDGACYFYGDLFVIY